MVEAGLVRNFIVENLMFGNQRPIGETDSFLESGILDSTSVLELIEFLEERFEIKIQDDEVVPENLDSIENVVRFVKQKLGDVSAAA